MPYQNRVTPFSNLIATPERGTLYGNRGCLHDDQGKIRRHYRGIRWIICVLEFRGRRHPVMKPGRYTDLFFLDEAIALAAGHRPCAECQRGRFNLFREHWAEANPELTDKFHPLATQIDAVLHEERVRSRQFCDSLDGLPDGTLVTDDEQDAYLVLRRKLHRWTPGRYENVRTSNLNYPARILTPASVVNGLRAGYPVDIHPSAF
ncbi:MAG: hypothetical protein ABIU09_05020 [Pyrinomonadaceae bacterium]